MELYIGGYAQGKLQYVLKKYPEIDADRIVNHLHLWVKDLLMEHQDAEKIILAYVKEHEDCILICDEVGNGIVPMDADQREYRERLGRLLIELAGQADVVERVICGIGQRIK